MNDDVAIPLMKVWDIFKFFFNNPYMAHNGDNVNNINILKNILYNSIIFSKIITFHNKLPQQIQWNWVRDMSYAHLNLVCFSKWLNIIFAYTTNWPTWPIDTSNTSTVAVK